MDVVNAAGGGGHQVVVVEDDILPLPNDVVELWHRLFVFIFFMNRKKSLEE